MSKVFTIVLTGLEVETLAKTLNAAATERDFAFRQTNHFHHAETARELYSLSRRLRNTLRQHAHAGGLTSNVKLRTRGSHHWLKDAVGTSEK